MTETSNWKTAVKDLVSGTFGGIAQTVCGHPLDTIKVRLQNQVTVPGEAPRYTGMVDCMRKTLASEGLGGMYAGVASPLTGAVFINAALFFSYGQSVAILRSVNNLKPKDQLSLQQLFVAGGMSGFFTSFVESPFDLVKVKLQNQIGKGEYGGVFDAARKITQKYGVRGFFQGLQGTLIRDVPAYALYFSSFEWASRALTRPGEQPSISTCFIAGGVSGFGFWGTIYPLELIKTRLQADALAKSERKYSGWMDCWNKSLKEQGFKGLWKGYVPSLLRAVPVNAVVFVTVTQVKRNL